VQQLAQVEGVAATHTRACSRKLLVGSRAAAVNEGLERLVCERPESEDVRSGVRCEPRKEILRRVRLPGRR
jgi:hypothetical protein